MPDVVIDVWLFLCFKLVIIAAMDYELGFGDSVVPVSFEEDRVEIISTVEESSPLTDNEIGNRLDAPISSDTIEEIINSGDRVLIVVPDATRSVGAGQIVNLLVRRIIAAGTMPYDIEIIFATGTHREVTEKEKAEILSPFIVQRIKTSNHTPRDLAQLIDFGSTSKGIPIKLNRKLIEFDRIITVGGIAFHYFAGFTGGRKLICPGLASTPTIVESHRLAFDCETKTRAKGVGAGKLIENPVNDAFIEVCEKTPPDFSVNTIVNKRGEVIELFCGDWKLSHKLGCEEYARRYSSIIDEPRELVLVSCGGAPNDINLIQAHKALESAANACIEGGEIILVAKCEDGLGRNDFLSWFAPSDSSSLANRLCEKYAISGQTAWSFMDKTERFNVKIFSDLSANEIVQLGAEKIETLDSFLLSDKDAFLIPLGAKHNIKRGAK